MLEDAVRHYEAAGEAAVERMRAFEVMAWLAGLAILLGTAFLIFAPMVRRLKENLAETRAANAALAESEERFALAAQGASVGIRDHYDLQQDEEYWSPQLYRLLGYAPGMLAPRASTFNTLVHPDDRQRVARSYREASGGARAAADRVPSAAQDTGLPVVSPDRPGDMVAGRHAAAPDYVVQGHRRAQAIEEMKSEFVSTVSHELRTPITSIMGALGLMRSRAAGPLSEKGERLAVIAHDNCERLVRLINDLLDVEKIEAGKIVFDFQPEPLNDLLLQAKEQN